jgi:hypothetical protein
MLGSSGHRPAPASSRSVSPFFLPLLLLLLPSTGPAALAAPAERKEVRILFIGNSLTYVNDLPTELQAMAKAGYPDLRAVRCEQVTVGGATLRKLWEDGKALEKIKAGGWDYVVLQEQSQTPIVNRGQMFEYAKKFDEEIKRAGAKTVLYMTWPNRKKPDDLAALAGAYQDLGKELGAEVVPVGKAWHESQAKSPAIDLYAADGVHPSPAGTYLAACCFAEALWGEPHKPLPRRIAGGERGGKVLVDLPEEQARRLQEAAKNVAAAQGAEKKAT